MLGAFLGHEEPVFGVAWEPDGTRVFSSGRDRKIRLWKTADVKQEAEIGGFGGEPFHLETAGGMLFVSCADGIVRQYGLEKRNLVRAYERVPDWVYCIALDAKNQLLAAGCYDGEVRVWDTRDGKEVSRFIAAPGYVRAGGK